MRRGDAVHVLILAEGLTARFRSRDNRCTEAVAAWQEVARRAGDRMGVRAVRFANLPDNRMDSVDLLDVIKQVEEFLKPLAADRIIHASWRRFER